MSSRMLYNRPLPVSRIVTAIADSKFFHFFPLSLSLLEAEQGSDCLTEAQINTQHYGHRPYGVGLLVAGYDVRSFPSPRPPSSSR